MKRFFIYATAALAIIFPILQSSATNKVEDKSNVSNLANADKFLVTVSPGGAGSLKNINWQDFRTEMIADVNWSAIPAGAGWTDGGTNVFLIASADNVGIGTNLPMRKLDVTGDVKGKTILGAPTTDAESLILLRGTDTSPTADILTVYNHAGDTVLARITADGSFQMRPAAASPAIAAGTGAGTGPTISIVGSDTGGIITITTGTSCATSATILTATFTALAPSFAPGLILSPMNAAASALAVGARPYGESTNTTFLLKSGATALSDSTTYIWAYKVVTY